MTSARLVCPSCGAGRGTPGRCADDGAEVVAVDDPLLGTELGGYRLARRLGHGGMGVVYLGVQPTIGAQVAIKVVAAALAPARAERLIVEARAANRIAHPGVVAVFAAGLTTDGRPYLVMERLRGASLASVLARAPLPPRIAAEIMIDVVDTVGALHAAGVLHRDLKPSNLFVTRDRRTKVLDFGIAKLVDQPSTLTVDGTVLGTADYMAPEQARGEPLDHRADLYALGVILREALAGERSARSSLAARAPGLAGFDPIIATALAPSPRDRFVDAAALAGALREVAATLPAAEWPALDDEPAIEPVPAPTVDAPATADTMPPLPITADLRAPGAATADQLALGRYRVEGPLGVGGAGAVVRAFDPIMRRTVAIKRLHAAGPSAAARLLDEAQRLARINHPGVVTVHEFGRDGDQVFLVMEQAPGIDLARWLAARPRPWPAVLAPFLAAGHGLSAAHAAGLVHRDFKPENVLVDDEGRAKIVDFGLAVDDGAAVAAAGTPAFMAPEQLDGPVDARADQFAFAAALWRALHDEAPFAGTSATQLAAEVRRGALRRPRRAVPPALTAALTRALAAAPDDRYPTMDALVAALTAAHEPARRGRRGPAIAALATLVVGGGLAAAGLARPGAPSRAPTPVIAVATIAIEPDPLTRLRMLAATPGALIDPARRWLAADALARGPVERIAVDGEVHALTTSRDGRHVAIATATSLYQLDRRAGSLRRDPNPDPTAHALALHDGALWVAGARGRFIVDADGHASAPQSCGATKPWRPVEYTSTLTHAICVGAQVEVVDLATDRTVFAVPTVVRAAPVSPDGTTIALIGVDRLEVRAVADGSVRGVRAIGRTTRVVVGDRVIALWDGAQITLWTPDTGAVVTTTLDFDPTFAAVLDEQVAFIGADGALTWVPYDPTRPRRRMTLDQPVRAVFALWSHQALLVAHPRGVTLLDLTHGIRADRDGPTSAVASTSARGLVIGADGATVTLWHPALRAPRVIVRQDLAPPPALCGDSARLAWHRDQALELRDLATDDVRRIATTVRVLGEGGCRFAFIDAADQVTVVDPALATPPRPLGVAPAGVRLIRPSASGALLLTSDGGALQLPSGGRCADPVAAFDLDRDRVVTRRDGTVAMCDPIAGTTRAVTSIAADEVLGLAGNGKLVVVAPDRVRRFDVDGKLELDRAISAAGDGLELSSDAGLLVRTTAAGVAILRLDRSEVTLLPGSRGARRVALAPDGTRVAALVDGALLEWQLAAPGPPRWLGALAMPQLAPALFVSADAVIAVEMDRVARWPAGPPRLLEILRGLAEVGANPPR